jgi:hypothetical protein
MNWFPYYTVREEKSTRNRQIWHVYTKLNIKANIKYLVGKSRDSAVGIGSGYGLDDQGVGVRSRAHPASYPVQSVPGGSFHGIKRPGREAGRGEEYVDLYIHSLERHHGLLIEHRYNVTLLYHQQISRHWKKNTFSCGNNILLNLFRCRKEPSTR